MFGYIILRDIPKREVQIDLLSYRIKGGFRGFAQVPPGLHYVNVPVDGQRVAFWHVLTAHEALVRVLDPDNLAFVADAPENEQRFQHMALGGAMHQALMPYTHAEWPRWAKLTTYITNANMRLNQEPPVDPLDFSAGLPRSRFEQAFQDTHQSNLATFQAEFQCAFVRWLVNQDDEVAFKRWQHLVQATYNAGEHTIAAYPALFVSLVDVLVCQFEMLPDDWFSLHSFVSDPAAYLIEDMTDTGLPTLMDKAKQLAVYLKQRGVDIDD